MIVEGFTYSKYKLKKKSSLTDDLLTQCKLFESNFPSKDFEL